MNISRIIILRVDLTEIYSPWLRSISCLDPGQADLKKQVILTIKSSKGESEKVLRRRGYTDGVNRESCLLDIPSLACWCFQEFFLFVAEVVVGQWILNLRCTYEWFTDRIKAIEFEVYISLVMHISLMIKLIEI